MGEPERLANLRLRFFFEHTVSSFYSTALVITDQYPPSVTGGAELSLHAQIKSADFVDTRIVVIALDPQGRPPMHYWYDGIEVYRVPFVDSWPRYVGEPSRKVRYMGALREFRKGVRERDFDGLKKIRTVVDMHKRHKSALGALPNFDRYSLQENPAIREIERLVVMIRPDLVHADNYRSILIAAQLKLTMPVISSVRDNRFFCAHRNQAMNIRGKICTTCEYGCVDGKASPSIESSIREYMAEVMELRLAALRQSSVIVATSKFLEDELAARLPDSEIVRVPNITESPEDIKALTQGIAQASPPEILCVGMIGHNKGQTTLLRILPELCAQVPDLRLVFAGRGGLTTQLQAQLAKLELRDKAVFSGFLSRAELYRSYARASVVVCPNVWPEPFGRVPLEAALVGRPVVAFDTGGIAENIIDGVTGFVVPAEDSAALAERLVSLLTDQTARSQMGEQARERGLERHRNSQPGVLLETLWQRVVAEQ